MDSFFDMFGDLLRAANVVLAIWAMIRLVLSRKRRWKTYSERDQIYWNALFGAAISTTLGSIVLIAQDVAFGPQILTTTITMIFLVWGTYKAANPNVTMHISDSGLR